MRTVSPLAVILRAARTASSPVFMVALLGSCGGDAPTPPPDAVLAGVTMSGAPADGMMLIGQSVTLKALGVDAAGVPLPKGSFVVWSSSNANVARVSTAGEVTAVGLGDVKITARVNSYTASFDVIVRMVVATPAAGAAQAVVTTVGNMTVSVPPGAVPSGTVVHAGPAAAADTPSDFDLYMGTHYTVGPAGATFAQPLVLSFPMSTVPIEDQPGLAIYAATQGAWVEVEGGTVGTGIVVSAPITRAGTYAVLRRASPASLQIREGNQQAARAGSDVQVRPSVVVRDARGRPVRTIPVTFAVTAGGGTVTNAVATTDAAGIATLGSWTLGDYAGENVLQASFRLVPPVTFSATGTPPLVPTIAVGSRELTIAIPVGSETTRFRIVDIVNSGPGVISGLRVGTISYDGTSGWARGFLDGTSAPTSIFVVAGGVPSLPVGTYTATVPILSAGVANSPKTIRVTLVVEPR